MSVPPHLRDLLEQPAPVFVHKLYRRITGRIPDEYETSYYLHRLLIGGVTRETVITEVMHASGTAFQSEEERFVIEAYRELSRREPSAEELLQGMEMVRSSLLGYVQLLRQLGEPLPDWEPLLPSSPDIAHAVKLDGEAFVRGAWRAAARRDPSSGELASASDRLSQGTVSKAGLLQEIGGPPETGHNRWFKLPVIGRLLHVLALVWNLPGIERDLNGLRHRHADLGLRVRLLDLRLKQELRRQDEKCISRNERLWDTGRRSGR